MDETTELIGVNWDVQKALVGATEYEFSASVVEEHHEHMLSFMKGCGLCGEGDHTETTRTYFNRKETALMPPLEWQVGSSTFKLYTVLVTEVIDENAPKPYKELKVSELLESGDKLARIVLRAFDSHSIGLYSALWPKYIETQDGTRFLRMYTGVSRFAGDEKSDACRKVTSYLKFYKNGYPKPYGRNEDAASL